jgi:hypothetical protein
MKHSSWPVWLAAAALTGAVAPAAHAAPDVSAYASDGSVLAVGSVVAQGAPNGDVCTFADDAVTLATAHVGAIALQADDSCRLVVTFLGVPDGAFGSADPSAESRRPKIPEDGAVPASVGPPVSPGSVTGLLPTVGMDAATKRQVLVTLSQTVYRPGGIRQYEDYTTAQYFVDTKTGALSNLEPLGGYCIGDLLSDTVFLPLTEVRSCFYKTLYNGPNHVGFRSGGYYRTVVAGHETDGREMTETFDALRNKTPTGPCDTGGALPKLWTKYCFLALD